jgi:hypothetical protein
MNTRTWIKNLFSAKYYTPLASIIPTIIIAINFPRISGHTERIEIKEENFIKEVCYGTRKEKKV